MLKSVRGAARVAIAAFLLTGLSACAGVGDRAADTKYVYVVRHAEVIKDDPDKPLSDAGRARAQKLVRHLSDVRVTHIYASHTDRTRDTVAPLAQARGMSVTQFPKLGSEVDGELVSNRTSGKLAIKPLVAAVREAPGSSTVVVAANSGNLYGVLAGLGVRVDAACSAESIDCIPCADKTCFPEKRFDNIWKVKLDGSGRAALVRSTYGE